MNEPPAHLIVEKYPKGGVMMQMNIPSTPNYEDEYDQIIKDKLEKQIIDKTNPNFIASYYAISCNEWKEILRCYEEKRIEKSRN